MAEPNHFTNHPPANEAELAACFAMLQGSPYDTDTLTGPNIIRAWDALLREGVGNIHIIENPSYHHRLQCPGLPPFCSFTFTSFITREYAAFLVRNTRLRNIGMDFLERFYNFKFNNKGGRHVNPAVAADEVYRKYGKEDYGLYYISLMFVLHPRIVPNQIPLEDANKLTIAIQQTSDRMYGGWNCQAWFNDVIGDYIKNTYLNAGHKLLREHNNAGVTDENKRRYLLCVTRDHNASRQLGIPGERRCELQRAEWFSRFFSHSKALAGLTHLQKKVAYLLAQGYDRKQIAWAIYGDDAPSSIKRVSDCQTQIGAKLQMAGYPLSGFDRDQVVEMIRLNMHEVRPIFVPLYPEPGADSRSSS